MKVVLLLGLSLFTACVAAEDVIADSEYGAVNWTTGEVEAHGQVIIPANLRGNASATVALQNKAKLIAYRNLAEVVAGIRVTSSTTVENMMLSSDVITSKVDAMIRGARVVNTSVEGDLITVTLSFNTNTGFVAAILPAEYAILSGKTKRGSAFWSEVWGRMNSLPFWPTAYGSNTEQGISINSDEQLVYAKRIHKWLLEENEDMAAVLLANIEQYEKQNAFTGLLIDARAINEFELAVIPSIRNQRGEKIYPGTLFSFSDGRMPRPVSYDFSINDATANKRIASNPFYIKALSTFNKQQSDLVISDEAAELLINSAKIRAAVQRAAVMIVISQ